MQSEKRKQKRVAGNSIKKSDILCVKRNGYIGKMYVNGVTLELTTTCAVLSRAYIYNVFLLGSVNYAMLKYIYELNAKTNRTEEEERELENGKYFILSFIINDAAGTESGIPFNFKLFELLLMKMNKATEEEVSVFLNGIAEFIKENNKVELMDQSDLESEEIENENNIDLNHVREGFNMIDSLPDEMPSDEVK